jgi:hypothetical protein
MFPHPQITLRCIKIHAFFSVGDIGVCSADFGGVSHGRLVFWNNRHQAEICRDKTLGTRRRGRIRHPRRRHAGSAYAQRDDTETDAKSFTTLCQSTLTISAGSGSNALDSTEHAVAATFNPSKSNALVGTVEMKGWKVSGALLDVNGSGDAFAEATLSRTGVSYSVNANSMTIGGVTYKVIPGVVTNDVIQQFAYVGIETGNNSATNGVAFIQ